MQTVATCENCGSGLSRFSAGQLCATCLFQSAVRADDGDASAETLGAILPREFGDYELLAEIGRGGMGVVYRARQAALDRVVALKVLLGGAYSSESLLRRFKAEAAAAAALRHTGIVAIHDFGEVDGQPFYTMELVEGRNLAQLCDGRPLEPTRAAHFLRAIAAAVHFAHVNGVLHRDLKPANVLIDHDDRPRVTDFGLAKRLNADPGLTVSGHMIGSPSYAAPEQTRGAESAIGPATDVYGLGALLYHLLTGRPPYVAATVEETLWLLRDSDPVAPRALNHVVPRDLETICLRCLEKHPAKRYPTARELVDDIDRLLSDQPIQARPPGVAYRCAKFVRRNRTVTAATGLIFLSLTAGLIIADHQRRQALAARTAADLARTQAEGLINFIREDVAPELSQYGRLQALQRTTQQVVDYFDALPPALRSAQSERNRAIALETLADIHRDLGQAEKAGAIQDEALAARRRAATAAPDDPALAAELASAEWRDNYRYRSSPEQVEQTARVILDRMRRMHERHPENLVVREHCAYVLRERCAGLAYTRHSLPEAITMGEEACAIFQDLIARTREAAPGTDDSRLRALSSELTWALHGLSWAYVSAGDDHNATRVAEAALTFTTAALNRDPENVRFMEATATAASNLSYRAAWNSLRRSRDAELVARDLWRKLVELEPKSVHFRSRYACSHMMEATYLRAQEQWLDQADAAYATLVAELSGSIRPHSQWEDLQTIRSALRDRAGIAARAGRIEKGRALLAEAREWQQRFLLILVEGDRDRLDVRERDLAEECAVFEHLRDWDALHGAVEERLRLIAALHPADAPSGAASPGRASARRLLGLALMRSGKPTESAPLLEAALDDYRRDLKHIGKFDHRRSDEALTRVHFTEALIATGQIPRAREILEAEIRHREAWIAAQPEFYWYQHAGLARAAYLLASTLDSTNPETSAHRRTLLARAAAILGSPDAEQRLSVDERELKERIDALRSAVHTTTAAGVSSLDHASNGTQL